MGTICKLANYVLNPGDRITCKIKNIEINDAVIHFEPDYGIINRAWICHNLTDFDGDRSPRRHGYNYSWHFHVNGLDTSDGVSNIKPLLNFKFKDDVSISIDLLTFIKLNQLECFLPLFNGKLVDSFDEYNKYEISKNLGFIILKNDRKSIEIKLGRFIRQSAIKFNEIEPEREIKITDQLIEKLHNKFVTFQSNDNCLITFLSGEKILEGYNRKNYYGEDGGTLHKSCMTNKFNFLNLYTHNPNQIKLAVIYINDKVAARCFVWTTIDGKQYSDRVYYRFDWMEDLMKDGLRKMGIYPINEQGIKVVQLEKWEFEKYPYADHFYHLDKKSGLLVSISSSNSLRNTDGTI